MPGKYKKILVVNTFGIGDVLFSTPLVRALKRNIPHARIDFMCNERCRCLLQDNADIDDILIFEKDEFREAFSKSKIYFIKKMLSFIKSIKRKRYDLAIDLSLGYQLSLLLKLLGIKKRLGFNYKDRGRFLTERLGINGFNSKHVIEYYLDILKLLGIDEVAEKNLKLELHPELIGWADDFERENRVEDKRLVGIAPGGGKSWGKYAVYRRWDPQNFSHVARSLLERNPDIFFLIFGSEEEKNLAQIIEIDLGSTSINLCGRLSLSRSVALIKRCELLLCNDGGILHTAVSQGVSTISIFGPVDDRVYGPYPIARKHKVVKAEGVECRPCYRSFKHKTCQTHDCLEKIDRDLVLKLAEETLNTK